MSMIAALYVQPGGAYYGLDGVDPWPERRDARGYAGPWPVVAHPPCSRWGRYALGGPAARVPRKLGDDAGCFAAALLAVRTWGGVLEHPEGSRAWRHFDLNLPPYGGGWVNGDFRGGWTCCVEQGWYGHRAPKRTWLYAVGCDLPSLRWGDSGKGPDLDGLTGEERRRAIKTGVCQRLSHKQRAATPPEFRDLLLSIARTACSPLRSAAA